MSEIPFLTKTEALFLALAPYEYPARPATRNEQAIAVRLARKGLLERAPGRAAVYRCTEFGTDVVERYRIAKWLER
jgi:predicted transcriptional regulator